MTAFVVHLLVTSVHLLAVAGLVRGIEVKGFTSALLAALGLGRANAFVWPVLALLTLPLTIVTLGLFLFVLNALMLMLVAAFVPGFRIRDFKSALWGSVVLALLNLGVSLFF